MGRTSKLIWGLGLASGAAVLAVWLLSGPRMDKTRSIIGRKVRTIKNNIPVTRKKRVPDDFEDVHHYV